MTVLIHDSPVTDSLNAKIFATTDETKMKTMEK